MKMRKTWLTILVAILGGLPLSANALQSLDDGSLEEVTGREGIIVGLEVYFNAQKSMNAQLDGSGIGGTTGSPDGNCSGSNNVCRLAIQLNGREARNLDNTKIGGSSATQAVQGEWLMFKDSYFALKMPDLYLDGSFMGGTNAALSSATAYEGFFDVARFRNPAGACLLSDGSASGTACTVANIKATPALALYQRHGSDGNGGTSYSYSAGVGTSSGYDDLSLSLKIGRMAVEYDTGTCGISGAAACGYNQDTKGSFMGINIRDNNSPFAGVAIGGKMYLYGF